MHFHYMTYMATPLHKNACPGVMKFTISVDSSLVIITIHLVAWTIPPEKIFKKYTIFTFFTPKLPPLGIGRVYPTDATYKFGKDWPSTSWEEDVKTRRTTDDGRRRTPNHNNRSPEWLKWPKKLFTFIFFFSCMLRHQFPHWWILIKRVLSNIFPKNSMGKKGW